MAATPPEIIGYVIRTSRFAHPPLPNWPRDESEWSKWQFCTIEQGEYYLKKKAEDPDKNWHTQVRAVMLVPE